jgi:hypothetical protein
MTPVRLAGNMPVALVATSKVYAITSLETSGDEATLHLLQIDEWNHRRQQNGLTVTDYQTPTAPTNLRDAIALAVSRNVPDGTSTRVADAIMALPEMVAMRAVVEAARAVLAHEDTMDLHFHDGRGRDALWTLSAALDEYDAAVSRG